MTYSSDLIDVGIEVFGGYTPAIPPSVLPPGASPLCQDIIFPEGGVGQRGGLQAQFGGVITGGASFNGLKTYLTPVLEKRLLAWDALGNFYKEYPQGTMGLLFSRPYTSLFYESATLFGREYQAFFNSMGGFDIPRQYDDVNWDRVTQCGPGAPPTVVDSGAAGNIVAGLHQLAVAFVTRQGQITQPSPPATWTAAGSKQAALTNIPIGPPNVIGRLLIFTPVITPPATTGTFYSTPTGTTELATPTAMLINDNVTTTYTVDFLDSILIASFQAQYLFTQMEIGEPSSAFAYSSRLGWLADRNKQPNFVNLSFDGGFRKIGGAPVQANTGAQSPASGTTVPSGAYATGGIIVTGPIVNGAQNASVGAYRSSSSNFQVGYSDFGAIASAIAGMLTGSGLVSVVVSGASITVTALASGSAGDLALSVGAGFQASVGGLSGGVNSTPWVNPGNVLALDGVLATSVLAAGAVTDWEYASGYGLAVPANATIVGVVAVVQAKGSTAVDISDASVLLGATAFGGSGGINHANGNLLTAGIAPQTYGNASDTWGLMLTPAIVNDASFGVYYSSKNNNVSNSRTASVDYISVTVYYTTPISGTTVAPLGWTPGATYAGGSSALLGAYLADWGDAFSITGDGATAVRGLITQSAYQDYLLTPIIQANTTYRVRARIALAGGLAQGVLHINLQSTTGAFTTAGLSVNAASLKATYQEFDMVLTTAIQTPPADLVLQIYADGTPTNLGVFLLDSVEPYPVNVPFNYSTARFSYSFNPESVDAVTGQIQVRPNDGQQLRAWFPLRNNLYLAKDHYLCSVTDDGVNEPSSWAVNEISGTVGICGPNAVDWTEEWAVFAERSGVYVTWGSDPVKITPEIQEDASLTGKPVWNSINWTLGYTIWVRIDRVNKRILVGVPIGASGVEGISGPNYVFVLDYKWLDSGQDIASSPMVIYSSFTGKILAHGRGRRWTYWNISANSMCFAERADGTAQPFFGNGSRAGKIYQQIDAPTQLSDDGNAINGFWSSHYSPSTVEEQGLQLGAHRKLCGYLKWRAFGSGLLSIAIQTAQRITTLRPYTLSLTPPADGGRGVNMHGERFSIQVGTNAAGQWWRLEKLIPCMRKDATIIVRGTDQ